MRTVVLSLTTLVMMQITPVVRAQDAAVRTAEGNPRKIIVTRDCAIYESPDRGSPSRPAKMFEFFYALKPSAAAGESKRNGFYRAGSGLAESDEQGWLHEDDVIEWNHRQALGLRPAGSRDRAEFFASQAEVADAVAGDKSVPPFCREPSGAAQIRLLPILDKFSIETQDGEVGAFQVAYLAGSAGVTGTQMTSSVTNGPLVDLSRTSVDVVFVIDSTQSMQPFIDGCREVIAQVARQLGSQNTVPVRFGLVAYRDVISSPGPDWYESRLFCDLETGADHAEFQRRLAQVHEASQGSEDFPENGFAGLRLAVQRAGWNPDGFRHLVVIGDASFHTDSHPKNSERLTIDGAIALAQPRGRETVRSKIAIHAIRVIGGDTGDHKRCEDQFQSLARGADVEGLYRAFDGKTGAAQFVDELVRLISKSAEGLEAAVAGRTPAADTPGLGLITEMINASEGATDEPRFASGFTCEIDRAGNQVFEPYVLVQYTRLSMFNSAQDFLVKALRDSGEPGSRDVQRFVESMRIFSAGVNLGEPLNEDSSLDEFMAAVLGFPVRSPIFQMSFQQLAAMTEADFESWTRQCDSSRSIIQSHLDNGRIWFSLGSDAPIEKRHCFLKVKDLP